MHPKVGTTLSPFPEYNIFIRVLLRKISNEQWVLRRASQVQHLPWQRIFRILSVRVHPLCASMEYMSTCLDLLKITIVYGIVHTTYAIQTEDRCRGTWSAADLITDSRYLDGYILNESRSRLQGIRHYSNSKLMMVIARQLLPSWSPWSLAQV